MSTAGSMLQASTAEVRNRSLGRGSVDTTAPCRSTLKVIKPRCRATGLAVTVLTNVS